MLVAIAGAAPASAAWIGPFGVLSPRLNQSTTEPQVAVDAAGNAVFVWVAGGHAVAQLRSVATGTLGPLLDLGGPGAHAPRVAVRADGSAMVTWLRTEGTASRIQARSISPAGVPGALIELSAPGTHVLAPQIGIRSDGTAVVAWRTTGALVARTLSPQGTPSAIVGVVASTIQDTWRMAVAASGRAVFVWERRSPSSFQRSVHARSLTAAGAFSPIVDVSAHDDPTVYAQPDLAVAPDGRAVVAWTTGTVRHRVLARRLSATGTPGPILRASGSSTQLLRPRVATDNRANAILTWTPQRNDIGLDVRARTLSSTGTPGRPFTVFSGSPDVFAACVGMTPDGSAVFAWATGRNSSNDEVIRTRARSATGALSAVTTLADPAPSDERDEVTFPQLAVAPNGRATIAWATGHNGLNGPWHALAAAGP